MPSEQHLPWFEKVIRDAEKAGEFDDLPGAGKPIEDIDKYYEAGWWARRFIRRERRNEAVAELSASIRRDLPRLMARRDDAAVRSGLADFNRRIEEINARMEADEQLELLDIETLMAQRAKRHFSENS